MSGVVSDSLGAWAGSSAGDCAKTGEAGGSSTRPRGGATSVCPAIGLGCRRARGLGVGACAGGGGTGSGGSAKATCISSGCATGCHPLAEALAATIALAALP